MNYIYSFKSYDSLSSNDTSLYCVTLIKASLFANVNSACGNFSWLQIRHCTPLDPIIIMLIMLIMPRCCHCVSNNGYLFLFVFVFVFVFRYEVMIDIMYYIHISFVLLLFLSSQVFTVVSPVLLDRDKAIHFQRTSQCCKRV